MKRLHLSCAGVIGAALLMTPSPGTAQVSHVINIEVHPGHIAQYEEAVRDHNEWHQDQNDTWSWLTYQATSGNALRYVTLTGGHAWSDFTNPPVDPGVDATHAMERLGPHAVSVLSNYTELLADLSNPPPPDQPIEMAQVTTYRLKLGADAAFLNVLQMFAHAAQSAGASGYYMWSANRSGDVGAYTLAVPLAGGIEDLGSPADPMAIMAAVYGETQAQAFADTFWASIESAEESLWAFRPDLSYMPGM